MTVPLVLLASVCNDLVANLEAQLRCAHALAGAVSAYHQTRHGRELAAVVGQLEDIRRLRRGTADILLSADIALTAASYEDDAAT